MKFWVVTVAFIGAGLLLMFLLTRLFRLRDKENPSSDALDAATGWSPDSSDCGGDGGD